MVALFLDDNKTNDDGDGTAKKVKGFYWQNSKFTRASSYFAHFFAVDAPMRPENSQFHMLALWSRWTQHKSCLFPLLNLDTVLSDSNLENFANICQIKWNWIKIDEVWSCANSLFKCRFRFDHPKILLPWQRDVTTSPLCRGGKGRGKKARSKG